MNLELLRKRVGEIQAKIEEYSALEDLSLDQVEEITALNDEFSQVKAKIEAAEKMEAMKAATSTSTRKVEPAKADTPKKIEMGADRRTKDPKGGFKHSGEFFAAVVRADKGVVDERLKIHAGHQEKIGEDGGFLIPTDFRTTIVDKVMSDQSLLPRTRQFQSTSNHMVLPLNEVAPWDANGIQAYWQGEAGQYQESKGEFKQAEYRLHKLTALVRATEEVLEDAAALESYIQTEAPDAMLHKINSAIIDGDGAGKPLGLLRSAFKVQVDKESGQNADTVVFENVNKMLGVLLPGALGNAVWLSHPEVLPQLRAMKFDASANSPVPAYMPPGGVSEAPYGTLYGRPIIPMMGGVKELGTQGDLILADLSYYHTVMKTAGIRSDISTHVHFKTDESLFKFSMRMAGQCPFQSPVTTENGSYNMSGIVTLADRA